MENYLKEMLLALVDARVAFVVGGGVAAVLHGVERVTLDLDIAVEMTDLNLGRLINAVEKLGLKPRIPVSLSALRNADFVRSMVEEKGALVFSLTDFDRPLRHLDIFLAPDLSYERLVQGAVSVDIGHAKIRVISREKLIELKRSIQPPRAKDRFDLEELSRAKEDERTVE